MTYFEALIYLGEARRFGMKLGLDSMRWLAQALGNPEKELRFIHLAGTNGKGSTAAFCESCLRASGFRVGLYTSPHLVSIRERLQIDRQPITEADFAMGMGMVRSSLEPTKDSEATFFELITALALWYFSREKVDWVVWETGLGGRFDATNIVIPEVSVITNIGLEHTAYLGHTVREIAGEKAGIIKAGVPVVTSVEQKEATEVLLEEIRIKDCPFTQVDGAMAVEDLGMDGLKQLARFNGVIYRLGLLGPHQVRNAACAVAVMEQLKLREKAKDGMREIGPEAIAKGLDSARWPGRFEIVSEKPLIVLDGAHNSAAMEQLKETWQRFIPAKFGNSFPRAHLVFASLIDKDISQMAQQLRPLVQRVSLVRLAHERTADPSVLAPYFSGLPWTQHNSVTSLWPQLMKAKDEIPTLITGSLFLVGEILAQQQGSAEEYRLNERLESLPPGR